MSDARDGGSRIVFSAFLALALLGCADVAPSVAPSPNPVPPTLSVTAPAAEAPTPGATAAPPPSPPMETTSPVSPTGEAHWVPVSNLTLKYEFELAGAIGFDDGYVLLVGETPRFSADGKKWKTIRLPVEGGVAYPSAVATDGRRVVVVGAMSACRAGAWGGWDEYVSPRCRMHPASWVSENGRAWRRSGAWTGRIHLDADERNGSQFVRAWAVPTGGFDAMQAFWSGDMEEDPSYERPILWHSDDGRAWTRLGVLPAETWIYPDELPWGGADASGRRLIALTADDEVCPLWSSADGRRYQQAAVEGPCEHATLTAPPGDTPWVLLDRQDGRPFARSSTDLASWTSSPLPTPKGAGDVYPAAVAWSQDLLVAVAGASPRGADPWTELTWLSDDGLGWRLADVSTQLGWGDLITYLADGPAGLLGFARESEPDEASDWYKTTITVRRMEPGPRG